MDGSVDPDAYPQTLRLFTHNCWGLKYLATYRHERLVEIGRRIALLSPPPDIVGLQECWTQQDYTAIRDLTSSILPHGKYYHSGIFGGGLAILSRWPIEESTMLRYPLNGRPTAFFRGDWFVGKGVACARMRIGPGARDVVEVFCTHLHAPYEREPNDSYICHRTAQAWEIAKLMRAATDKGHLAVGLGDFNMVPLSLAHRLIEAHAPVKDVWRLVHPESSLGAALEARERARGRPTPTLGFNLARNGTTCDSVANTWRWDKQRQKRLAKGDDIHVDEKTHDPQGRRLDYIFAGTDEQRGASRRWTVDSVRVGMTERHPTLKCSLSDHFSVEATLTSEEIISRSVDIAPTALSTTGLPTLPVTTYDEILAMVDSYNARERRQRRLRLGHFGVSLVVSIGCLVAVWWSPRNFVAFLLMLVSTLNLAAGVIDGLIGGLFVGSELRALKEFEWDIINARSIAERAGESTRKQ